MQTVGIRDLQVNPAVLTRSLENDEYVMITKRGKPLGVAASLDDEMLRHGFGEELVLKAFVAGDISLGQLSKSLGLTKRETMRLLAIRGIPLTDYDISEDLRGIEKYL